MANNVGTLVIAPVRPQSTSDVYPVAIANEIRGGHHSVASIVERDAIAVERLDVGMFCTTKDSGTVYILRQILPSLVWEEFVSGSSSNALAGVVELNTADDVYTVSHPAISGTPLPMTTLVAPDEFSNLFVESIYDITNSSFKVVLSGVPNVSGYKINWTNGPLELTTGAIQGVIGEAEDGTYEDGLFVDFVPTTPIGTAVDRFNEILKGLAPPPAPVLSSMSMSQSGVTGGLSFGPSNVIAGYENVPSMDINDTFTVSGNRRGIMAPATKSGTLANNVVAHSYSYPSNAFGFGDQGVLNLIVNGVTVHSVDLSAFASGSTLNGNNSGFTLSSATNVQFESGDPLDLFKFRTGTWFLAVADQTNGYNEVSVTHVVGSNTYSVTDYDWVNDADTTNTSFSAPSIHSLNLFGSKYISGVEYYTDGTALFDITIDNAYRNTFASYGSALDFDSSTTVVSDDPIPTMTTEADTIFIEDKNITLASERLIDEPIDVSVTVGRTVQSNLNSGTSYLSGILLDNASDFTTDTSEYFAYEGYRLSNDVESNMTDTSYGSGPFTSSYTWDNTASLVGGDSAHNDGLLLEYGELKYPTEGANNGDYDSITFSPPGNVNYAGASGNRTYYRYFFDASPRSNFVLNIDAYGTNFVDVATGPSGNDVTVEILAPNTTQDSGSTIEFKDAVTPFTSNDDIGMYASTFGSSIPTNWGLTLGSRDTSTSGNVVIVKITASSSWSGRISDITINWL